MNRTRLTPSFAGRTAASASARSAAQGASKKRDTQCEVALRRALWALGFRYRITSRLIGRPDLVFARQRVAVFCDGDFWHGRNLASRVAHLSNGHNAPYWTEKIRSNVRRDHEVTSRLMVEGWWVMRLWESDILKDPSRAAALVGALLIKRKDSNLENNKR